MIKRNRMHHQAFPKDTLLCKVTKGTQLLWDETILERQKDRSWSLDSIVMPSD